MCLTKMRSETGGRLCILVLEHPLRAGLLRGETLQDRAECERVRGGDFVLKELSNLIFLFKLFTNFIERNF